MVEAVPGQGGVVGLQVEPHLALQTVPGQEPGDRGHVVVVLVLGRLGRLGLDQDGAGEPDPVLVLHHQVEEAGQLGLLAGEVGVEQGVVALAATPQHVVRPAHPVGRLQHVAHLGGGHGEDLGVGVGRGTGGVARVGEQVRRPPQQSDAGPLHVAELPRRPWRRAGRTSRRTCPPRGRCPGRGSRRTAPPAWPRTRRRPPSWSGPPHRVPGRLVPGPVQCPLAEHVGTGPHEAVPEADGQPEVVLHAPASHHTVGVVPPVAERVVTVRSGVGDRPHRGEELRGPAHARTDPARLCASRHLRVESAPAPPSASADADPARSRFRQGPGV